MIKRIACAAALLVLTPVAALAAHGKAGLWSSTTTVTMGQGVPPQTHTATYCMTPDEVKSDAPPAGNKNCAFANVHATGHSISADMVCKGDFEATGHFESTYDTDTHYTARISMQTSGMSMVNTVEGHWLKADCAGAQH